ncbi:PucR family transcriptional regulator [Streptomyces sp. WAC06614]|uniref:PucR family transcriptional regulator n=1 Tax=Streptomyces sp. WAC06614 TaxID=2487416 RepID=UPI000F7B3AEE|nr:PucR family transcriptional regulator [Streptomyces sp. WAC06614]RSS83903.1 PucR family transcriptional regulator [Streptomyces sp. WAC06614]
MRPGPPTPAVGLGTLLGEPELGLRLAAGPPDAPVHGVHASEMADPTPYLLGGELLLTAGAWSDAPAPYVARLVRAGVAALGFGVTPVHERVPEALAGACAAAGLPLVEVDPGTPFAAVARAVWRLMAEARTRELRRVTEAQQALAAAAARPDPVPAVLSRLAASLGGHVVLRPDGRSAGAALPPGAEGAPAALEALLARVGRAGGPATATDQAGGWHLAAYALGRPAALGTATPARTPGDHTVASVAAVLLTLLTAERPAGTEAAGLTRLLLGGSAADVLGPGPWYAVHARGGPDPAGLAAALGTVLVAVDGSGGVRLVTEREPAAQPGWRLGVSAPAGPEGLATADAQAARALERAEASRAPLARHTEAGLAGLVGEAEARAHAEALLGPLPPALRATLRAWLAHHGSWDRSAAALGVHRNTVRQRISRCAVLLGRDLDDPDTRMELWFALRQEVRAPAAGPGTEMALDRVDNPPVT